MQSFISINKIQNLSKIEVPSHEEIRKSSVKASVFLADKCVCITAPSRL